MDDPQITEAVRATFGKAVPESLEPLRGGLSKAALFKLTIAGRSYVIRHLRSLENDPAREFACMTMAAERGLAPRVLYANAADGVCITEFVEAPTLAAWLQKGGDCVDMLGPAIRTLHEGPPFPPFMSIERACTDICAALAAQNAPAPFADERLARIEEIRAALAEHVTDAPCHYDLNPGNILVDGTRVWLIDWEIACAGDPFHDVATPGIFILRTPELRAHLLHAYLGREANAIERARLVLSRVRALTLYGLGFAQVALARGAPPPAATGESPSPTGDPARFGEGLEREAQREHASAEYAGALAAL